MAVRHEINGRAIVTNPTDDRAHPRKPAAAVPHRRHGDLAPRPSWIPPATWKMMRNAARIRQVRTYRRRWHDAHCPRCHKKSRVPKVDGERFLPLQPPNSPEDESHTLRLILLSSSASTRSPSVLNGGGRRRYSLSPSPGSA
jgi:hypothetical protein